MSELTVGQIITIIIAVFVLAIVVVGAGMAFTKYIIPFFKGYTYEDKRNLDSAYYKDLVKSENVVGTTDGGTETPYIILNGMKSVYYFSRDRTKIKEKTGWYRFDKTVAQVDSNWKIKLTDEYSQNPDLKKIDGGELIGKEIYKRGGSSAV